MLLPRAWCGRTCPPASSEETKTPSHHAWVTNSWGTYQKFSLGSVLYAGPLIWSKDAKRSFWERSNHLRKKNKNKFRVWCFASGYHRCTCDNSTLSWYQDAPITIANILSGSFWRFVGFGDWSLFEYAINDAKCWRLLSCWRLRWDKNTENWWANWPVM